LHTREEALEWVKREYSLGRNEWDHAERRPPNSERIREPSIADRM